MPFIAKELLDHLLHAGTSCSNVLYNLAQKDAYSEYAPSMRIAQTTWDGARSQIRAKTRSREDLKACPTSAPAWAATTPRKAKTDSAPKPAARKPTSANSRRSDDASRQARSAARSADIKNRSRRS